jgi:hypothetical protein
VTRQPLTEALRRLLDRRTPDGRTVGELLVEMVVARALAGDIRFIRLIFDRIEVPTARRAADPAPAGDSIVIEPPAVPLRPRSIARRRAV